MAVSTLLPVLLVPFIGWRLYSRYRKLVGRQAPRTGRLWMSMLLFPLVFILIGVAALRDAPSFECLLLGGVGGAALAFLGLKLTRYESAEDGLFYTPNFHIGVSLMLLFVGRMAYRFIQIYTSGGLQGQQHADGFGINPVTTLIMGIVFCYYPVYSSGILRWSKAQTPSGQSEKQEKQENQA
ncbi:hypothetical protein [Undibacterium sp.]|uniref:hypothetical protein n=1 Tax=Undibacterium sp. TaxID=1914977 RepID=UPI00374D763E